MTYNRKDLLRECLKALLSQTRQPDEILVINNASTDGTEELFAAGAEFARPGISLVTLPENVGGAGGFCEGIERAMCSKTASESNDCIAHGSTVKFASTEENESAIVSGTAENKRKAPGALWIMDDDTIPEEGALAGLLRAEDDLETEGVMPSFLASAVFGPSGEPMNVPVLDDSKTDNGYADWYRYLSLGCVAVKQATFVSLFLPCESVKKAGLPIAGYFIWGDDTEYTRRLVKECGPAYLCGGSRVLHKRYNIKKISIWQENDAMRVSMYFYYFRNALYNAAKYEGRGKTALRWFGYAAMSFTVFFRRGQKYRGKKFLVIQKGCWAFLFHRMPL